MPSLFAESLLGSLLTRSARFGWHDNARVGLAVARLESLSPTPPEHTLKKAFIDVELASPPTTPAEEDLYEACSPRSWPASKKLWTAALICLYTCAVYLGASICIASVPEMMSRYSISSTYASLAMAVFVLGYGVGALLFSPLSEIPSVGRNPPYIISLTLFVVFSIITAVANSWPLFLAARFFQGFMGSPALATGGASLQDMYDLSTLPFALIAWMAAATCGPALGPTISIYTVNIHGWRFPQWEMVIFSGGCLLLMLVALPETYHPKIAMQLGISLPKDANTAVAVAPEPSPLKQALQIGEATLMRPMRIMVTNPAIFFANFYTCLIYAIYYSFFESFPRVYMQTFRFTHEEFGLAFLSITVGTALGIILYSAWAYRFWRQFAEKTADGRFERCLAPAVYASVLVSAGVFIFAFASKSSMHWSVSLLGVALNSAGVFIVLQCLAYYLLLAYREHAASLLAGNDVMRASLAAAAIVFSQPLYDALGIEKGVLILAGATVACVGGMVALYTYGHRLR